MRFINPCLIWAVWLSFMGLWLGGCAVRPSPQGLPVTLQSQILSPEVIELPVTLGPRNLMIVRGALSNGEQASFVIDTGATLSSIYRATQIDLGLSTDSEMPVRIHGMISTQMQSVTTLESLSLGGAEFGPLRVAVIDEQNEPNSTALSAYEKTVSDGIIGMDVLQNYHLYYDPAAAKIWLIPHALGAPAVPSMWEAVELSQNPFLEDGRALHFFKLHIGFSITPALLDTGSEFNLMNWDIKRFPQLRDLHKARRKDWELQGAVGRFKPAARILTERTRAGERHWYKSEFLVLDFESLDVLGIEENPFVIAGMPMLSGRAMIFDFQNDRAYFAPPAQEVDGLTAAPQEKAE